MALTITYQGKTRTIAGWARVTGINTSTIRARLKRGYDPEEILRRGHKTDKYLDALKHFGGTANTTDVVKYFLSKGIYVSRPSVNISFQNLVIIGKVTWVSPATYKLQEGV